MSKTRNQDQAAAASNHRDRGIRLRIWPAVVIVLAQISLTLVVSLLGSTIVQNVVAFAVVPLVAALLLIIWWLAASRAPIRDRLIGLALFAAALVWVVFTQKEKLNGAILLVFAVPTLMIGVVALLAATFWLRWPVRRWIVVALTVICAGAFTAMRVHSVSGTLVPILSWRWSPTADDLSTDLPPLKGGGTALLPAQAGPGDWPGFRGPARDGHVAGTKFSTNWSTPPREMWRRRVGVGWSSFTAIGDYVFTQEQRGGEELVTCYRTETGENVWVNRVDAQREDAMGEGPRATPAFDQGRLYTQGATGILQCLDAATGNTVWKRSLTADVGAEIPGWGFSSSPLVAGELLIVFTGAGEGKSVAAYNRASGDVAWCAGHASGGYSSPHLVRIGEVPQVVMNSDFGVQSFEPETGTLLWEHSWKAKGSPRVVQPLFMDPGSFLLGATGSMGTRLLRIEKQEKTWRVNEEWTTRKFRPYFNDFVVHKGHCYGFDGDRLACINAITGKLQWEGKRYGGQLLLMSDMDMLLVLSETGDVVLIPATPEGFSEIASFKAITGKTWNHPVVAHGKLFVRNAEEAACFALGTAP